MNSAQPKPAWWWAVGRVRQRLDRNYHLAFDEAFDVPEKLRDKPRFLRLLPDAPDLARLPKIVLTGPTRQGKTFLAHHLLWHRVTQMCLDRATRAEADACAFLATHKLIAARLQHPLGDGESPLVESAFDSVVLVLDDLGNERHVEGRFDVIEEVVWRREAEGLTLWVTTGLTEKQIHERYGHAFAARVFEGATVLEL